MPGYRLPDLTYDYGALEPAISGQIMELHHGAHHAAYVKGANKTVDELAEARATGGLVEMLPGLERALDFHRAGHGLHSIFWRNLSPDGGGDPGGELAAAIDEYFGGFDGFRTEMTAATATIQGSGWGALAWGPIGARLLVHQIHDHHISLAITSTPLLVSTHGNTPSTCNTATSRPTTSSSCGRSSTGPASPPASMGPDQGDLSGSPAVMR